MRLYFLRHADAFPGTNDAARPLSPLGQHQSEEIARFLKRAGIVFDSAYSSPLVRAVQTAEIVLPITNKSSALKLQIVDSLLNETRDFHRWLKTLPEEKHVLLVGHAPSMPDWVSQLLCIKGPEALPLPKAGLACLKTDDRIQYTLKFFITPKALGVE